MTFTPRAPVLQIDRAYLATSIGDDSRTSVAALVACRQQFRHRMLDGHKLTTAPAQGICDERVAGAERLRLLLQAVAAPALADVAQDNLVPRPHVAVVLPSWVSLQQARQLAQDAQADSYWTGGATASFEALDKLWPGADNPTRLLLLAADSLCEPGILQRDHGQGLVHFPGKGSGWIAGEAAAGVLLQPVRQVRHLKTGHLGLHRPGLGPAPSAARWPSDVQGDGRALGQAFAAALDAAGMTLDNISHSTSDFDGAPWRADDQDAAINRLAQEGGPAWQGRLIESALWLGQVGAAWGTLQWALATLMRQFDVERMNTVLSYSQDADGHCAAAVLEHAAY